MPAFLVFSTASCSQNKRILRASLLRAAVGCTLTTRLLPLSLASRILASTPNTLLRLHIFSINGDAQKDHEKLSQVVAAQTEALGRDQSVTVSALVENKKLVDYLKLQCQSFYDDGMLVAQQLDDKTRNSWETFFF